ncbi:MAG TPA: STAS domain-containing protein [Terriglobales bacterium]|nr:STAS domain-containing protein [Terriglobales bacterium]
MLELRSEKSGNVVVVRCAGRIVHGPEADSLRSVVLSAENARIVVLDLSELESIDAGGLAELVLLHLWTRAHNTQLQLVNPSNFVFEMFTRTRLDRVLQISSFRKALRVLSGADCARAEFAAAAR